MVIIELTIKKNTNQYGNKRCNIYIWNFVRLHVHNLNIIFICMIYFEYLIYFCILYIFIPLSFP